MTIRRMKSMSGLRRFVSDYGFEGILHEKNIIRAVNFSLRATAIASLSFSSIVIAMRHPPSITLDRFRADLASISATPPSQKETDRLLRLVQPALEEHGLSSDDLKTGTRHFSPVESQLLEADFFLRELRKRIERQGRGRLVDVVSEIVRSHCGGTIQEIAIASAKTVNSVTEFPKVFLTGVVGNWKQNRYLDATAYPNKAVFGHRESSEAVGIDIGSKISTMFSGDGNALSVLQQEQIEKGVSVIKQWGFSVIRNAVPEGELSTLVRALELDQNVATEIGNRIVRQDPNVSHNRAMPNRLQLLLRGSALEGLTESLHSAVAPLVWSLNDRRSGEKLMLSDVRLVVVDHGAERGNWTLMNPRGGYTIMIPLNDRDGRMGTQTLLPASHFLADRSMGLLQRVRLTFQRYRLLAHPVAVTDLMEDGCWRAGDALVLDNRLLLRADENHIFKSGTYVLVKYESETAAPGGVYWSGKVLFRLAQLAETISAWTHPRL